MRLTKRRIDRITRPGIYGDGRTLYLRVRDDGAGGRGSAQWVQIITIDGKRYDRGLGGYPAVGIEDARAIAFGNRRAAKLGRNPFAEAPADETRPTFVEALEAVIAIQRGSWRNGRSEKQWRNSLGHHVLPTLGAVPVDAITTPDVLACVEPIWDSKRETASRIKQRISAVMMWAQAQGHRKDNPVDAVEAVLPRGRNGRSHFKALPWGEVPGVIAAVRGMVKAKEATRAAFEFMVLTAARSGEVRMATWGEFDLPGRTWTIPAGRMKAGAEHVVPLSPQAMAALPDRRGRLVFPASKGRPMSDSTLSKLLRDNGIEAVPHGFRSSFRDWCAEHGYPRDVAEAALAHKVKDAVEAAYHRTTYLAKRRAMMDDWGAFCVPKDGA